MRSRPLCTLGVLLAFVAHGAAAQLQNPAKSNRRPIITGVVLDSIAHRPLADAWIQLVATDGSAAAPQTTTSDSLGRFAFSDVADGHYRVGFYHAMLDTLGLEAPSREVIVAQQRAVRADLAIPSPELVRVAICNAKGAPDQGGVVIGTVRHAKSREPIAGATVTADWLEITVRLGGVESRRPRLSVTTEANGWFALCNVPRNGTMFLEARNGDQDTDHLELQVPNDGFVHRDLFLGHAVAAAPRDTSHHADSTTLSITQIRHGEGRLAGTVAAAETRVALPGAIVRVAEGPTARTDNNGAWQLFAVPTGSRVFEARAVGFYPVRRVVDVIDGAPDLRLELSNFRAVLDTVRVVASGSSMSRLGGFTDRQRMGMGQFITPRDMERLGVIEISDVFKHLRGVKIVIDSIGMTRIVVRDGGTGYCEPTFYVDGLYTFTLSLDEVSGMLRTRSVQGIEVYDATNVPPQFRQAIDFVAGRTFIAPTDEAARLEAALNTPPPKAFGCGAIVIWTK